MTAFDFADQSLHSSESHQAEVDSRIFGKYGLSEHGAHTYNPQNCKTSEPVDRQYPTLLDQEYLHGGNVHGVQMAPKETAVSMTSDASLGQHRSWNIAQLKSQVGSDPAMAWDSMAWPKTHLATQRAPHASQGTLNAKNVRWAVDTIKKPISMVTSCIWPNHGTTLH